MSILLENKFERNKFLFKINLFSIYFTLQIDTKRYISLIPTKIPHKMP